MDRHAASDPAAGESRQVRVSKHGYDEIAADEIAVAEVLGGVASAYAVEDYPEAERGPRILVPQQDGKGRPIHVVWGIQKGRDGPPVLIWLTALTLDAGLLTFESGSHDAQNHQAHS